MLGLASTREDSNRQPLVQVRGGAEFRPKLKILLSGLGILSQSKLQDTLSSLDSICVFKNFQKILLRVRAFRY